MRGANKSNKAGSRSRRSELELLGLGASSFQRESPSKLRLSITRNHSSIYLSPFIHPSLHLALASHPIFLCARIEREGTYTHTHTTTKHKHG
jgi:hypothetical protein